MKVPKSKIGAIDTAVGIEIASAPTRYGSELVAIPNIEIRSIDAGVEICISIEIPRDGQSVDLRGVVEPLVQIGAIDQAVTVQVKRRSVRPATMSTMSASMSSQSATPSLLKSGSGGGGCSSTAPMSIRPGAPLEWKQSLVSGRRSAEQWITGVDDRTVQLWHHGERGAAGTSRRQELGIDRRDRCPNQVAVGIRIPR